MTAIAEDNMGIRPTVLKRFDTRLTIIAFLVLAGTAGRADEFARQALNIDSGK